MNSRSFSYIVMALYYIYRLGTPRGMPIHAQKSWQWKTSSVQIKNIKLQIVTDIKVTFNSMLGFRISYLVGGLGHLLLNETRLD